MKKLWMLASASALLACALTAAGCTSAAPGQINEPTARPERAAPAGGTITGRIRLAGQPPGNPVIRMGADPLCSRLNRGTRVVQEAVLTTADGGLASVFVKLDGAFPQSPAPAAPVTIDQEGCIYNPRVVGVRIGQPLAVGNSDALMHNVHGISVAGNDFNVSQPKSGMVLTVQMTGEETMLRLRCDVHGWMTAYIGVVAHPYFSISNPDGAFEITGVPAGTYTIRTWHERYGELTQTVQVSVGVTATVDIEYAGDEQPQTAGIRDLHVPVPALHAAVR
jgi:hypothetical protein